LSASVPNPSPQVRIRPNIWRASSVCAGRPRQKTRNGGWLMRTRQSKPKQPSARAPNRETHQVWAEALELKTVEVRPKPATEEPPRLSCSWVRSTS